MKVIIFKLDTPGFKHEWFAKDFTIKVIEDMEQIQGFCANHIYAELYQVDKDDDSLVVNATREFLSKCYPQTAKDTIMRLFKYYERVAEVWNEQENKESLPKSSSKRS